MATREEIREGIKLYATGACVYQDGSYPCSINFETNDEVCLDCLIKKLDSQGVVIKVDVSDYIPDRCTVNLVEGRGYPRCGYGTFEPLIKEGSQDAIIKS